MTYERGEVYREGNRGAHYFLYRRTISGKESILPGVKGHVAGNDISTQVMTSSHTYDVISTEGSV